MKVNISIEIDGVNIFQPSAEKMKSVFNYVYRELGFVVVGQPRSALKKFKIGDWIKTLLQWEYDDKFEIYERGTSEDWIKQAKLIKKKTPGLNLDGLQNDGVYWRVRPVGRRQRLLSGAPRSCTKEISDDQGRSLRGAESRQKVAHRPKR